MRKPDFAYDTKTKMQINCAVIEQLISLFIFATLLILQSLYFLNPEFQAYGCTAQFVLETPKTGFLATRLSLKRSMSYHERHLIG